ncbi:hypothetical protein POM88_049121 [Heracleum sosnowskyi]|uniref:Uncharacterized protein n=1 Tax=Heracleum sosnowskyi TaxID=360622 RepID=A0AAD8M147_9APIA|nr:hypothetical protein POM88_049120 [Heracleum sosnowskyi]KAK1355865.1 hypothetical protein POM88_049121 [Heracleum sosnowskyi]
MDAEENIWINLPKYSEPYIKGIKAFLKNAFPKFSVVWEEEETREKKAPKDREDDIEARKDLHELGIRKVLHPVASSDGKHLEIRDAIFDMTNEEKDLFYLVLKNAKLPYGSASNIKRFFEGDGGSKITKVAKFGSCPETVKYAIGSKRNKDGKAIYLDESE